MFILPKKKIYRPITLNSINQTELNHEWFQNHIKEVLANVGPRYTPELNVDLPIIKIFDGLGKTEFFFSYINSLSNHLLKTVSKIRLEGNFEISDQFQQFKKVIDLLIMLLRNIKQSNTNLIPFEDIQIKVEEGFEILSEMKRALTNKIDQRKKGNFNNNYKLENIIYSLYELEKELHNLVEFTNSDECSLANTPFLLLVGNAGSGKTHLFSDITKSRINDGLPSILILGSHFIDSEPWSQIIRILGLNCDRNSFLFALNKLGEINRSRFIILIDAINEGQGATLWNKFLAGLLDVIGNYQWIGIGLSIRSSYEQTIIPQNLINNNLIRVEHFGFRGMEYEAIYSFFDYYELENPSIPLLTPEFENPLFLKLFCQSLRNLDLKKLPDGLQGITDIFDFYINSINKKLAHSNYVNYNPRINYVRKAIDVIINRMTEQSQTWLINEEAFELISDILPQQDYEKSLFRHMVSEGIIAEDKYYFNDKWVDIVRFTYERFSDHLIVKYYLDLYLDVKNPENSFAPEQVLGNLVVTEHSCYRNKGLIEALSIQLPEILKKEFLEILPTHKSFKPCTDAFLESLIWRKVNTISENTIEFINDVVLTSEQGYHDFLNSIIILSSNPDNPLNADFLHKKLIKLKLSERDSQWTKFLYYYSDNNTIVDRIILWSIKFFDENIISNNSTLLIGTILTWFLTSSKINLRNNATRALVNVFSKKISLIPNLLKKFYSVNDPYIIERLYAVIYGCVMRNSNKEKIVKIAETVYQLVFQNGSPYPHILYRDYARGIIEYALHLDANIRIDIQKIRPPYKSNWPDNFLSLIELNTYKLDSTGNHSIDVVRLHLESSVLGDGDFARYIIGTNSDIFEWSSQSLTEYKEFIKKEKTYNQFVKSLTKNQKKDWNHYLKIYEKSKLHNTDQYTTIKGLFLEKFIELLGSQKQSLFRNIVIPYLEGLDNKANDKKFDLSLAQRWIFKRVLDLGWSIKKFGKFDGYVQRAKSTRYTGSERIGKKYQWIAYYEFLALVSDNFVFKGYFYPEIKQKYHGPWQIIGNPRNIDPSFLSEITEREISSTPSWWCFPYKYWEISKTDLTWLKTPIEPEYINNNILVRNPSDNNEWLNLESNINWSHSLKSEDGYDRNLPKRHVWFLIKSYIVKRSKFNQIYSWASKQNFRGRWMPESYDITDAFLGEYYWAPIFKEIDIVSAGRARVTKTEKLFKKLKATGVTYFFDELKRLTLPTKWLIDRMRLNWNGIEGQFVDEKNNLVAFDPSVNNNSLSTLLINKKYLLKFLEKEGYNIFWTVLGEKNVIGNIDRKNWIGRLEINGTLKYENQNLKNNLNSNYIYFDNVKDDCISLLNFILKHGNIPSSGKMMKSKINKLIKNKIALSYELDYIFENLVIFGLIEKITPKQVIFKKEKFNFNTENQLYELFKNFDK